jgi:ABC-2 type transport system permease protein
MTSATDAMPDTPQNARTAAPAAAKIRPFYWSVRRELWENRSILIAPTAACGVVLFGFLIALGRLPAWMPHILSEPEAKHAHLVATPYDFAGFVSVATVFLVGLFYCLGALGAERRDRSILFWKSLPVSDLMTVASKAAIPLVVLPLVAFVVATAVQAVMLVLGAIAFAADGYSLDLLFRAVPPISRAVVLLYGLIAFSLWMAPVYAWLLLISGWARRAAFLWAIGPPLGVCIVEKIAFNTGFFAHFLAERLSGGFKQAFTLNGRPSPGIELSELDPAKLLASPGLWLGLVVAAALLYAAARQRRYREPV